MILNGQPNIFGSPAALFYDKSKLFTDKMKILINYNEDISKNFKDFQILEKNKNCYLIKKKND